MIFLPGLRTRTMTAGVSRRRKVVDSACTFRHLSGARQVPHEGIKTGTRVEARAAPATVRGMARIESHWKRFREGDARLEPRSQETCLSRSPNRAAGACCASGTNRVATWTAL